MTSCILCNSKHNLRQLAAMPYRAVFERHEFPLVVCKDCEHTGPQNVIISPILAAKKGILREILGRLPAKRRWNFLNPKGDDLFSPLMWALDLHWVDAAAELLRNGADLEASHPRYCDGKPMYLLLLDNPHGFTLEELTVLHDGASNWLSKGVWQLICQRSYSEALSAIRRCLVFRGFLLPGVVSTVSQPLEPIELELLTELLKKVPTDAVGGVCMPIGDNRSALMLAVDPTHYSRELLSLLLNSGCDPNLTDDDGRTALHHAVQHDNSDAVYYLLDHGGADANIGDRDNNTALHLAAILGQHHLFSTFTAAGADVGLLNAAGEAAIDIVLEMAIETGEPIPCLSILPHRRGFYDIPVQRLHLLQSAQLPDGTKILAEQNRKLRSIVQSIRANTDFVLSSALRNGLYPDIAFKGEPLIRLCIESVNHSAVELLIHAGVSLLCYDLDHRGLVGLALQQMQVQNDRDLPPDPAAPERAKRIMARLLQEGCSASHPVAPGKDGPLLQVLRQHELDLFTLFLSSGASLFNPIVVDSSGTTRLPISLLLGPPERSCGVFESESVQVRIVKALLSCCKEHLSINRILSDGRPAYSLALHSFELTKVLLDSGADLHHVNEDNSFTILHILISRLGFLAPSESVLFVDAPKVELHPEKCVTICRIAKLLVERGAEVDLPDSFIVRPLHLACSFGEPALPIVRTLLDHGADPRHYCRSDPPSGNPGVTAFHVACSNGCVPLLKLLVDHSPDVLDDLGCAKKLTGLHIALQHHHFAAALYIAECIGDEAGSIVLQHLPQPKNSEIDPAYDQLTQFCTDFHNPDHLGLAVQKAAPDVIESIIEKVGREALTQKSVHGYSLSHFVVQSRHLIDIWPILRRSGMDPNAVDRQAATAVLHAAANRDEDDILFLLNNGCTPFLPNVFGLSVLHLASARNMLRVIRKVAASGAHTLKVLNGRCVTELTLANVDDLIIDVAGATPLHCAVFSGSREAVELLIELGADIDLQCGFNGGLVDLCHLARHSKDPQMAELVASFPSKLAGRGRLRSATSVGS